MKNIIDKIRSIKGIEKLTEEDVNKLIETIGEFYGKDTNKIRE